MSPEEAAAVLNKPEGRSFTELGAAVGVAIEALREKVERESKEPKGPTLLQMEMSINPEAVWTFPDSQLDEFRRAAASVLRKLDEWLKKNITRTDMAWKMHWANELWRELGLPEREA